MLIAFLLGTGTNSSWIDIWDNKDCVKFLDPIGMLYMQLSSSDFTAVKTGFIQNYSRTMNHLSDINSEQRLTQ